MKKTLLTIIGYFSYIKYSFGDIKTDIIPLDDSQNAINDTEFDGSYTTFIIEYIRDSIFDLLILIAIGVFIFIGARLIMARGNPEEFKKALMQFIYAIVGLAIVAISWAAVKIISSLDF